MKRVGKVGKSNQTNLLKAKSESTVRFYDVLSVIFFILAAVSLGMLSLFLIPDFAVLGLGAMDIGTILNAVSRMISLRSLEDLEERKRKTKNTIKFFHVVSYACFAVAAVLFAIALNLFDTDFGVMGLELSGCGTILRAVSRSIYLESG
ncbi:hypothetical protein E6H36_03060 [Candidatus Bathyarchaeota archaeon]|nr:MAG: hypothetical protein E6H36_03060 [Candidatus Bathyarchaeota archaeon]TMI31842.1 MAG: hypothetical protein E6H29_03800 [Candidatus Bathyarchaeota archaeon]